MTNEIYITIFVGLLGGIIGLISGWYLKKLEFALNKETLRDKKFLEGKISVFHEYIEFVGEIESRIYMCIELLKIKNIDVFQKFFQEYLLIRLIYHGKMLKLLFYSEENSYESMLKLGTSMKDFEKRCDQIIKSGFKYTDKDIEELNRINKIILDTLDYIKIDLRYELGFEMELEDEELNEDT